MLRLLRRSPLVVPLGASVVSCCSLVSSMSSPSASHQPCTCVSVSSARKSSCSASAPPDLTQAAERQKTLADTPRIVGYCTDVEGSFDFWESYVENSRILDRNPFTQRLELAEGAHFVFGGDAVDQGNGDLAFLRDLMQLQAKYPSRVHIVLGNRDINKMRLINELRTAHQRSHPWKDYPGVYWRSKRLEGDEKGGKKAESCEEDTLVNRLKWILSNTMGSGRTFELRREELQQERDGSAVTDAEVVASFLESLGPRGVLRRYLALGQLGVIIGDTLFIHGGLSPSVVGWLPACESEHVNVSIDLPKGNQKLDERDSPGQDVAGVHEPDAHRWISRLNAFCQREVETWFRVHDGEVPCEALDSGDAWAMDGGYAGHKFPGSNILQYGMGWMPSGDRNPTLVYRDWMSSPKDTAARGVAVTKNGKLEAPAVSWRPGKSVVVPRCPHPDIVSYLKRAGIRRVVCGHKPHGDAALVVRSGTSLCDDGDCGDGSLSVITVDTSYSGMVKIVDGHESDNPRGKDIDERRGLAVSELLIRFEEDTDNEGNVLTSAAELHGLLCNGEPYDCFPDGRDAGLVGRVLDNDAGWIAKGRRVRDGKVLLSRLCGWDAENQFVEPDHPLLKK